MSFLSSGSVLTNGRPETGFFVHGLLPLKMTQGSRIPEGRLYGGQCFSGRCFVLGSSGHLERRLRAWGPALPHTNVLPALGPSAHPRIPQLLHLFQVSQGTRAWWGGFSQAVPGLTHPSNCGEGREDQGRAKKSLNSEGWGRQNLQEESQR